MAVFSVNQNRQLYVANAYKATVAGTDPAGTISVKADKAKKCFYGTDLHIYILLYLMYSQQ